MTNQCQDSAIQVSRGRRAASVPFSARVLRVLEAIERMAERRRQRNALRAMDDHMLRDLGVTRAQVDREIEKPFWRP